MPDGQPLSIVLAGGRATRMGGLPKTRVPIAGSSSLSRVLAACPAGERVVVGPEETEAPPGVRFVHEEPAFGGPVVALAAGLAAADPAGDRDVLILAGDMPYLTLAALGPLLGGPPGSVRAARDADGRVQYLCSCWPVRTLVRALRLSGIEPGTSMRQLFAVLPPGQLLIVPVDSDAVADVDTPQDLADARARLFPGDGVR